MEENENPEIETTADHHEETEGGYESREGIVVVDEPGDGKEHVEETPQAEEAPAYNPNFSYRVLKEEKEIPERFRALVTDETSEKEVRELFEKADGLEAVKSHRDQLQSNVEQFQKEWVPYIQETTAALEAARSGDFQTFFQKVGISNQQIFEYTKQQLELMKDPQRYAASEQSRIAQSRATELEQNYAQLQNRYQQVEVRQRDTELKFAMERPEIRDAVQAFDQRMGAGAFRAECIRVAQAAALSPDKRDLSADEAIDHVIRVSGWAPQQKTVAAPARPVAAPRTVPRETKTLPNITGKATSPAKRIPKSLDDLRQLAKEAAAADN